MTLLDEFAPKWQFREVHAIAVLATPDRAYRAIETVTAGEITLFRALTWFRRMGRVGPESILNAPPDEPILDVALRSGFLLLAASPPGQRRSPVVPPLPDRERGTGGEGEIVVGTVVIAPPGVRRPSAPRQFTDIHEPGYAKAVMNFRIDRAGLAMCVVTTETRVYATDPRTRRKFGIYWWTIRAGSGLIRRMWLRAIRRRAETIAS
jgi:hypothetical protein